MAPAQGAVKLTQADRVPRGLDRERQRSCYRPGLARELRRGPAPSPPWPREHPSLPAARQTRPSPSSSTKAFRLDRGISASTLGLAAPPNLLRDRALEDGPSTRRGFY